MKAAPPKTAVAGESEVNAGTGLLIVKVAVLDEPPPGAGLVTCTGAVPAVAISDAGTEAVSCVELTNVVVRLLPFQLATELDTKPEPFTVRVKAGPPAVELFGESVLIAGVGFGGGGGGLEDPPPHPAAMTASEAKTYTDKTEAKNFMAPSVFAFWPGIPVTEPSATECPQSWRGNRTD